MMYTNKALALKVLFAALLPAVFMAVNLLMLEDSLAQLFSFWPPRCCILSRFTPHISQFGKRGRNP